MAIAAMMACFSGCSGAGCGSTHKGQAPPSTTSSTPTTQVQAHAQPESDDADDADDTEIDPERTARLKIHPSGPELPFTVRGVFSEDALSRGVRPTTKAICDRVGSAVWVPKKTSGKKQRGDCIKYWASGFGKGPTPRAIVFFPGDAWVGNLTGSMEKNGAYLTLTEEKLQASADMWAKRLNSPYMLVGRPGMDGSSGDHMQRRRVGESLTISAAMDRLKEKYGIKEWVVVGQSGGGHVTASLVTERSDIVCAVPTSAPSAPRLRYLQDGRHTDYTGYPDSYEPAAHVDRTHVDSRLRVFVLGNPADTRVIWASQTPFADKLKEVGIPVRVLTGEGTGTEHHSLGDSGRTVAGWCAHDLSDDEIVARASKGLKG
jgi:hypothetical protein